MHTGSCHCRAVRFEIEGDLEPIQVCHCGDCRKAQGGPFGTNIPVETSKFRLLSGAEDMQVYESTADKERVFCRRCGGPLFSRLKSKPQAMRIRAGALDGPVETQIGFHFYTASKANWWPITDDKPQYPDARPV